MDDDLNITIHRLEEAMCDLTDKQTECVVCTVAGNTQCIIAMTKFLELLRFEQKKSLRKNSSGTPRQKAQASAVSTGEK